MDDKKIYGAEINMTQLAPILLRYAKIGGSVNEHALFLHGPPGVGKTSLCRHAAKETDRSFYRVGLPTTDYNQMCGIPRWNGKEDRFDRKPLIRIPREGRSLLLIDDTSHAPHAVQNIALDLVNERQLLDVHLSDECLLVFAANIAGSTFPLMPPIANRFEHYYVRPDYKNSWRPWAISNGIRSEIIAFLDGEPDYLCEEPSHQEKAFGTPRSWHRFSSTLNLFYSVMEDGQVTELPLLPDEDRIRFLSHARVGAGSGNKFIAFLRSYGIVRLEDVLSGGFTKTLEEAASTSGTVRQILEHSLVGQARSWFMRPRAITRDLARGLGLVLGFLSPAFQVALIQDIIALDPKRTDRVYQEMLKGPAADTVNAIYEKLHRMLEGKVE